MERSLPEDFGPIKELLEEIDSLRESLAAHQRRVDEQNKNFNLLWDGVKGLDIDPEDVMDLE